jgi:hypothetical protein
MSAQGDIEWPSKPEKADSVEVKKSMGFSANFQHRAVTNIRKL